MKKRNPMARADEIIGRYLKDEEELKSTGREWQDALRLWRQYLPECRTQLIIAGAVTLGWSFLPFGFNLSWRYLVDHVLKIGQAVPPVYAEASRGIIIFMLVVTGLWMWNHLCWFTRTWLVSVVNRKLVFVLRRDLHRKLADLHIGYYERMPVGRIISRVMDDVNVIYSGAVSAFSSMVGPIIKLIAGPALLLYLNWQLGLLVILVLPLYMTVFFRLRPQIRKANIVLRRINSQMYGLTAERISGIRVVQTFGREISEFRGLAGLMQAMTRVGMRLVRHEQNFGLITQLFRAGLNVVVLGIMVLMIYNGEATLGDMVAFLGMMNAVLDPAGELFYYLMQMQASSVVLRRVFALLDEPVEIHSGRIMLDGMHGRIHFNKVTFSYPGQNHAALTDVDFRVEAGEKVALVGPSGSGKSTVLQLLLRFYDPQQGSVRVGGVNLKDADLDSLRRHVCLVQQEPMVFSGSIMENIMYGRLDASIAHLIRAATAAEIHGYIMSLPAHYETQIGAGGVTLSGGERQRVALATALLTNPEVLLLDDTTSALDAATEVKIRNTLKHVLKDRTGLIVTQRVATAQDCDRIIVLQEGRITQMGRHQDLILQDGFYRNIYEQQQKLQ